MSIVSIVKGLLASQATAARDRILEFPESVGAVREGLLTHRCLKRKKRHPPVPIRSGRTAPLTKVEGNHPFRPFGPPVPAPVSCGATSDQIRPPRSFTKM
jgi:hypothetical protein